MTCAKTQGFLARRKVAVTTQADAKKATIKGAAALGALKDVDQLYVAKGKRVVHLDLKREQPSRAELLGLLLGPTGNLRAPTLRKGRTLIVGFDEATYERHIFFDTGRDQLLAFMEARGVPGVPARYEAGINRGLGVPNAFYHFAFEAGSEAGLEERRNELIARGVEGTEVVDHDWGKSIYFKDP